MERYRDTTLARLEIARWKFWLISSYLGHDYLDPFPVHTLEKIVIEAERQKISDFNDYHTVWRSTDINDRDESLSDYILGTYITVSNVRNEATFVAKIQVVLNTTLLSDTIYHMISDRKDSKEHSFFNHGYIQFNIKVDDG